MVTYVKLVVPVLLLILIPLELIWARRNNRLDIYNKKETVANLVIMVGNQVFGKLWLITGTAILGTAVNFRLLTLPETGLCFLVTLLTVDFAYYWFHRLLHESPLFWTLHHVHHSSPWMNLTTAVRLNWFSGLVGPLYYAPLIWLGFPPRFVAASIVLNLIFQFFLHTQAVAKLGPLEGWLNTPSAHRVHHGRNPAYLDKNFGGLFVVWDRLFGTWQSEIEAPVYGVTTGFAGHNPIRAVVGPFFHFCQGVWRRARRCR